MTAVDDEAGAVSGRVTGTGDEPVARDGGGAAALTVACGPGNKGAGASDLVTDGRGRRGVSGADDTGPAGAFAETEEPDAGGGAGGPGGGAETAGA